MRQVISAPSILLLCSYQAPYGGNFIASVLQLDEALTARGASVHYMFPIGAKERAWCMSMAQMGKDIAYLQNGGLISRLRQLLELLDRQRITILHVHFGYFALAELAALLRPKLRIILHFHSDFSGGRAPSFAQRMLARCKRLPERLIGKRLQKVTVSEGSRRTTSDCIALHNALCETRFCERSRGRDETRAILSVKENETLVLVFGWSPWIKGVDIAAEAVRQLQAKGETQFALGIVCGRTCTQEKMRTFITEHTGCTGAEPYFRYLPPDEDVFAYHKAADIMVSASRSETFSYALLEAIATGKPCICSDIPGVRWAQAFDTVRFYETEHAEALAQALTQTDYQRVMPEYGKMLDDAAAKARVDFAIDDWVNGMLAIYNLH